MPWQGLGAMLKTLRTTRGFGVHSPLAFELITDVLCSRRNRYYASAELPSEASRRWLRVLLRFAPAGARVKGPMPLGLGEALNAASVKIDAGAKDFTIYCRAPQQLTPLSERGVTMVLNTGRDTFRRLTSALPKGYMTFSGRREHYIVARPDLPRQHFNLWLR